MFLRAAFLGVLAALAACGAPAWGDVPFQFDVRVEGGTAHERADAGVQGTLVIQAAGIRGARAGVAAQVGLPAELGGPRQVRLQPDGERWAARVPFSLPEGPARVWEFPIMLTAGGRQVLFQDVRLTKAGPWWVLGPFPGNRAESHDRAFPPEGELERTERAYEGKNGRQIRWQPLPATCRQPDGCYDLNSALGFTEDAVAYLAAVCHAPRALDVLLLLGSDDSVKVWHNGTLIHDHNLHRGLEPAQDVVPVRLAAGRNAFLLKVVNDDGGWGFAFDLRDARHQPIPDLKWEVQPATVPLADPELRLTEVTRTEACLRWRSDDAAPATVFLVEAGRGRRLVFGSTPKEALVSPVDGAPVRRFAVPERTTRHSFRVRGLQPGRRYLVWVEPARRGERTERLAFYTAPPEGIAQYVRLRVVVAVFTNAAPQRDAGRPGAQTPCPPAEIERLKREIADAVRFYWVHTGMRLALDVHYLADDTFIATPDGNPYGVGYTPGDDERLQALLRSAGRTLDDYDGCVFVTFEKEWDEGAGRWVYPASGGGTLGPENPLGIGKAAWKGGSDNAWLFCHEFGHELDGLYHHSMGPEYLFNHFQPWDGTAHRHGEHWDGNAWLLWWWGGYVTESHPRRPFLPGKEWFRYLMLRWGEVADTPDRDGDGIPDRDPAVPLDEERFGSSPSRRDTDGDGLDDLAEAMACNWVERGLGETWAGDAASHRCNPRDPDTDRDGVPDGRDPYPLYAIDPVLRRGAPRPFVMLDDGKGGATLSLGWDEEALTIRVSAAQAPESLKILLDADDDGWFVGGDNLDLRVRPAGGMQTGGEWRRNPDGTFAISLHHCAVPGKWPFYDASALPSTAAAFTQESSPNGYSATIRLPRSPQNGLCLRPGERIGILFGLRPQGAAGWGTLTPFEPHTFVAFTLR